MEKKYSFEIITDKFAFNEHELYDISDSFFDAIPFEFYISTLNNQVVLIFHNFEAVTYLSAISQINKMIKNADLAEVVSYKKIKKIFL